MEPPNLRLTPYEHGHACESCRAFSIKEGKFHCGRFDVKVASRDICDDYEFAGGPYKGVPKSLTTERSELLNGQKISPRWRRLRELHQGGRDEAK